MGINTSIEWADSTLNLQMGCDGCELWNPAAGIKHCYAGILTERYQGTNTGFPEAFDKPKLFLNRLDAALRWPDLTGKDRPDKPWLSGQPRIVFLDDMGDTFTESLPLDWLAPLLPRLAASPHAWLLLTKRGGRMRRFSEAHPLPPNVWPGVSVTSAKTLPRVQELFGVKGGGPKWISAEPLLSAMDLTCEGTDCNPDGSMLPKLGLVITGCESGPNRRPFRQEWDTGIEAQCRAAGVRFFRKQIIVNGRVSGNPSEWEPSLRTREFPEVTPHA